MTPIMLIVAPLTPRLSKRFGAQRVVGFGMVAVAVGFLMFTVIGPHTSYLYVLAGLVPFVAGMALTMSPMTASIMSAVPARRAGAGSAMNDATRELGAALGVAVLGSVAASKYTSALAHVTAHLPAASQSQARASLSGALQVANRLPVGAATAVRHGADVAFVDGIHLACIVGAALAMVAAGLVVRYLPSRPSGEDDPAVASTDLVMETAAALAD
jgi:Na+/melibiose symporter-like transporter